MYYKNKPEYGKQEIRIFKTLGMLDVIENPSLTPIMAWMQAAYICFMDLGKYENVSEAVRFANKSFDINSTIRRLTEDFETALETLNHTTED